MADVASSFKSWSASAASNSPTSSTTIGAGLAPNLQQIQATLRSELGTRSSSITASSTVDIGSKDEGTVLVSHVSGTVAITSFGTVSEGIKKLVTFSVSAGTLTLTYNATSMILPSAANMTVNDGDSLIAESLGSGNWKIHFYSRQNEYFPNGMIYGLTMSTAGSSTTMTVSSGAAADAGNSAIIRLAASISKTTSSWAVGNGNGGLDTGTIANNTWYYFYLIRRPDTGVVDVIFSLSSSSPTLPSNYTQYRYIGGRLTNGSAQWTKITQVGDDCWFDTPVLDYSGAGSTTAVLLTISVPRGRKMKAYFNIYGTTSTGTYLSDPANADLAPSSTVTPLAAQFTDGVAGQVTGNGVVQVFTNTTSQIRYRSATSNTWRLATLGWTDLRGKDA